MNNRIKELAEKATTIEYGVDNGFDRVTFDKEKFAELIVEECASLFPLQFTDEQYQRRIDKTIKKHFGLQE